jgi:hypothetical protein
MITIVLGAVSTPSSQRIVDIRLLVGSSSSRMSDRRRGLRWNTRSFQYGATALIGPWCCSIATPRPSSSPRARFGGVAAVPAYFASAAAA